MKIYEDATNIRELPSNVVGVRNVPNTRYYILGETQVDENGIATFEGIPRDIDTLKTQAISFINTQYLLTEDEKTSKISEVNLLTTLDEIDNFETELNDLIGDRRGNN